MVDTAKQTHNRRAEDKQPESERFEFGVSERLTQQACDLLAESGRMLNRINSKQTDLLHDLLLAQEYTSATLTRFEAIHKGGAAV
jgi:hypothetical protein